MKKKIAILGSTGSIGKNLINILKNDKKNFEVVLLSTNKNYKELLNQAKIFNVKNLIINNKNVFDKVKLKTNLQKINIFNNFSKIDGIFDKKIDYVMSAITGIDGLVPTLKIIQHTKNIAIANKEAIICGWPLIKKKLDYFSTNFYPVDSEHFSIWYALNNYSSQKIEKLFITASGGSLLNVSQKSLKDLKLKDVLKHPNWKMGKKITIDSSTMMNKVFEVIEAKNIFSIPYKDISILIHPSSYVHALVKFNNGMTKIIVHDTTMKVPIFNTIYSKSEKKLKSNKLNLDKLNNLNFTKVDLKKFPLVKILKILPKKCSLFETVLVATNDELVNLYLNNKIKYTDISHNFFKIINLNEFKKYKKIKIKKVESVLELNDYVRFKINSISI
jgi:1-deoxy-D-xylulose-5-phosphate reductoisomerase